MKALFNDIKANFNKGGSFYMQLIVVNLIVFFGVFLLNMLLRVAENGSDVSSLVSNNLALNVPFQSFIRHPWTVISFLFTQHGLGDLLFNMLSLFYFGYLMQDYVSGPKMLNSYILGGLFAALGYIIIYNIIDLVSPRQMLLPLVNGCSAGVFSIIFSTVAISPNQSVYLFGAVRVKIKYLALIFLLFSFVSFSYGLIALLGGTFGYLYIKLLRTGIDLGAPFQAVASFIIKLTRRKKEVIPVEYEKDKEYVSNHYQNSESIKQREVNAYPTEDEVDALLDKISRSGYASLSPHEKNRLYLASKKKN